MKIVEVPAMLLPDFWPLVVDHMAHALVQHPFLDSEELRELVAADRAALFVLIEGERLIGAFALEALDYPSVRVGNVIAAGWESGDFENHARAVEQHFTAWARQRGCRKIAMLGRAGWSRFLQRQGWQTMPLLAAFKEVTE